MLQQTLTGSSLCGTQAGCSEGHLVQGEHVAHLTTAHSLPLVSSSDLLTLKFSALTVGEQGGVCVTRHSSSCVEGMKQGIDRPRAAFLMGLNTRNLSS